MKFNSLDAYAEAGRKAGRASKNGDAGLVRHLREWKTAALRLESGDYKREAERAYDDAYRAAATPTQYRNNPKARKNPNIRFAPLYVVAARRGTGTVHYYTGSKLSTHERPRYYLGLSRATDKARDIAGRVPRGVTVYLKGPISRMKKVK
jgi:hypothetical protein